MPRGARLDAPGTLHHVIVRGIEQRNIVEDDTDRERFVSRMGKLAIGTSTSIFAWALLDNHAHLLIRSGPEGLATFMRRLLTGYAVTFNLRHKRAGHLFQNRYKSIVCEEDAYFTELVRYIHLNPLRAGAVDTMAELDRHPWCGHTVVLGKTTNDWQERNYVLKWFGRDPKAALRAYRAFVVKGIEKGRRPELVGGGLVRSMGGWSAVKSLRKLGVYEKSDERILGSGAFVEKLLADAAPKVRRQLPLDEALQQARLRILAGCQEAGIDVKQLRAGSRLRSVSAVRSRLALELTDTLGLTLAETARQLGVSTAAISKIRKKAEKKS